MLHCIVFAVLHRAVPKMAPFTSAGNRTLGKDLVNPRMLSEARPRLFSALQRGGVPIVDDMGFHLISDYDFVPFRAQIDMKFNFFSVGILDPVRLTIYFHQRTLHGLCSNALR